MRGFDRFVGIDWSGARGERQRGIAVAVAEPGAAAPVLAAPPGGARAWSRAGVVEWLATLAGDGRTLVGLDFAFGFPPLPDGVESPSWAEVDAFCAADPHLYGGRFFDGTPHPLSPFVFGRRWKGPLFSRRAQRETERVAAATRGASPSSPLLAIGPAQVGPSTISGMRALHRLGGRLGHDLCVWPFREPEAGHRIVTVEIFPRFYPLRAGLPAAMRDAAKLDAALAAYGSAPAAAPPRSEDEGDALIGAAALRTLAGDADLWGPVSPAMRREGWIFGVPPGIQEP